MCEVTKADIAAIRQADRIVCTKPRHKEAGEMRCIKDLPRKDDAPYAERERIHTMAEVPVRLACYAKEEAERRRPLVEYGCFASCHYPQNWSSPWRAVGLMLRPGDRITLYWVSDSNGYTRKAGLHHDELRLIVERTIRGVNQRYTFHIESSICPMNSARMIRPGMLCGV